MQFRHQSNNSYITLKVPIAAIFALRATDQFVLLMF